MTRKSLFAAAVAAVFLLFLAAGFIDASQAPRRPVPRRTPARKRPARAPLPPRVDPQRVNDPNLVDPVGPDSRGAAVVRAEILLDRMKFSPGEIEAAYTDNMKKAISAFQRELGLDPSGIVDAATWASLNKQQTAGGGGPQPGGGAPDNNNPQPQPGPSGAPPALVPYTVSQDDVAGPFTKLPRARTGEQLMLEEAKLEHLNYGSPLEAIAEKFHINPKLLTELNPGKNFDKPDEEILAPNVLTPAPAKADSVVVDGSERSVKAVDAQGKVLAFYPATIGSPHDPLPVGNWKILGKRVNPEFHYNPNLFWDSENKHARATLPPGPKSPVGVVWISLSKAHYGIHGTPNPAAIGRTQSHGCIRLTNWDATELASMVAPGTPAILKE
jgi:lipoprotein-anchoring transpeptidase ErfK/SrfK